MEEKNYRAIFRQKKDEVHTHEEILQAFDSSFCVCFTLAKDQAHTGRRNLFGKLWEINPDAIIAETDLFVVHPEPVAARKQYLLICKNGTQESNARLAQCLEESGVITSPWYIRSKKEGNLKTCYQLTLKTQRAAVILKANLLIDGDNLLLSVRHLSDADHAQMKVATES